MPMQAFSVQFALSLTDSIRLENGFQLLVHYHGASLQKASRFLLLLGHCFCKRILVYSRVIPCVLCMSELVSGR